MPTRATPFGKLLRTERKAAHLSQGELARAIGVSDAYVGEVERGNRPPLAASYWPKIVRALPFLTLAALERAAAQSRPLEIDLAKAEHEVVEIALGLSQRIRAGDLRPDERAVLLELTQKRRANVRAHGRVVDADGTPITGRAFLYRATAARGWSALVGARAHAGRVLGALDGRAAALAAAKPIDLLSAKDPRGAGFFDVPGGLEPGDYALDVKAADGRELWAWPFTVIDGAEAQDVRVIGAVGNAAAEPGPSPQPTAPAVVVPADLPPVPPLAKQFTRGTFTACFSYYGLGGAPLERIQRDLTRIRAAGFGNVRVWVDWERPSAASRILDRKGNLISTQAEKLDQALDLGASLGVSFDLTLETSHYDAIKKSAEGYDIAAHKNAVRNVLTRWGKHPALRIVDLDNEAEVRGAGGHGSPDTGHTSPGRFAELMAVARSVPRTCIVGASCSASIEGLPKDYQLLFRDTKGEILLPHFPRAKGWGANEGPNAKTLAAALPGIPIHHHEPARNGHSTSPAEGWPVSEFEASFRSSKAAGSLGCCFHTDAAFDLTAKDAWDQLDPTERQVVAHVAEWVR